VQGFHNFWSTLRSRGVADSLTIQRDARRALYENEKQRLAECRLHGVTYRASGDDLSVRSSEDVADGESRAQCKNISSASEQTMQENAKAPSASTAGIRLQPMSDLGSKIPRGEPLPPHAPEAHSKVSCPFPILDNFFKQCNASGLQVTGLVLNPHVIGGDCCLFRKTLSYKHAALT
jgi:hypothetical protein